MAAPLDDVKVIEVDSWMATPSAGAILADLGADVIKVEPLDGDPLVASAAPPNCRPRSRTTTSSSTWTIAASAR